MANITSAAPAPRPGFSVPAGGRSAGEKGAEDRNIKPFGVPEWRRKWRPLAGRIPADRPAILRWRRHFAGTPEQVGQARHFTRFLLADSSVAYDAAWVTGELATNAIRHTCSGRPGGMFTVEILRWRHYVQVQVIDAGSEGCPVLPPVDPATAIAGGAEPAEGGLGLCGISVLACRFGTHQHTDGSRVVWVRLKTDAPRMIGGRR